MWKKMVEYLLHLINAVAKVIGLLSLIQRLRGGGATGRVWEITKTDTLTITIKREVKCTVTSPKGS